MIWIFSVRQSCQMVLRRYTLVHLCLVLGYAVSGCASAKADAQPVPAGGQRLTYWPVALEAPEGRVEVYQPQPEAMQGDKLTARAAVSLTRSPETPPVFGAAWFTARVVTDRDTRTVRIREAVVKDVRVPGSTPAEQKEFASAIGTRLSRAEITFPLEQLTASLDTARCEEIAEQHIATAPPRILFSTTPATLISVNGAPRLQRLETHPGVSRVVNTPFILLMDDAGRRYFVKAGSRWVSAASLSGPWADTASVPTAIAAAGAELSTPPPNAPSTGAATGSMPRSAAPTPAAADARIIVATEPTELIVTNGDPQFTPVPGGLGGQLVYASNTASDLFLDEAAQRYYVLLSGRWYTSASLQGPWQYAPSDHLPPTFAQIPVDSPKADVLPFVGGTAQAHEAVLDAGIPQTASVRRDAGADLSVAYDGDPRFQDVPESPGVAYALNTPEDVLRVNGQYYCCHQAVWYESTAAAGPWAVCLSVPPVLYTLPPSCPAYHVRYVSVYDYYPDYVVCGYLPGYTGTFVYGPTIVYGTGYAYPGWYGTAYFPPPMTWGFGVYYDPFAFTWGFDVGLFWGGGFGWFGHPWHERWWHDHPGERWGEHRWWGPAGFVHSHEVRSHLAIAREGGAFREAGHEAGWNNMYAREGNRERNIPAARLQSFDAVRAATGARDNVFAGSDGRVFRRSDAGWEEHGGVGGWSGVGRVPDAHSTYQAPAPSRIGGGGFARPEAGLDQHFAARSQGAYQFEGFHNSGGGEFRGGGGGGFHGGGGRR